MSDTNEELRGAAKKEAFHQEAEAKIVSFGFKKPAQDIPVGKKAHVKLAGTNSCRASVQILNRGGENNLHYHPNMDLIYMVLKGKVAFYGPDDKVIGEYGPNEGLLLPENSRYWFGSIGDEEAWLLQIAGYPKGAEMSKRIPLAPARADAAGVWFGLTDREQDVRQRNNKL
jgi:quercetin dioxygenase-like cupin family protein